MPIRKILLAIAGCVAIVAQPLGVAAQVAQTPSPWSYAPDVRAPTDEEYRALRSRFTEAMGHREAQNWGAAIPLLRENVAVERRTYGPEHPVTGMALFALASTLEANGDYIEAEAGMLEAIRIAETWLPPGDAWFSLAHNLLGMCQGANGKRTLAEASFRRAIALAQAAGDARAERIARSNLADMTQFFEQQRQ